MPCCGVPLPVCRTVLTVILEILVHLAYAHGSLHGGQRGSRIPTYRVMPAADRGREDPDTPGHVAYILETENTRTR